MSTSSFLNYTPQWAPSKGQPMSPARPSPSDDIAANTSEEALLVLLDNFAPYATHKTHGVRACQCMVSCLEKLKLEQHTVPHATLKHLYAAFRRVRNTNNTCAKVYATRGIGLLCEMAGGLRHLST
ncbi:unnamed protein product [Aphanomyces euteiches]|uniref:Uncharacterized protein n=1 Tax=Aphanomyces euteiches TaxID=100861 RepID=A0A6G0WZ45_9STRA|nr:hypothetical protein Ae201684_010127 [Aphanomyces euteiches]KAH9075854.1 hypothetical protein Ae201684P_012347 [Aphanomyces euteiches]KAH9109733.1 hypothetical protein AeMF1_015245 [Aphanomyces euteiches]KAH9130407.1 hypothetical protein LEN26_008559 [Aphanomyces euteiches]KAH9145023.1 hypothetical protein AeRB84_011052 [Aphanomyces euteiches]